MDEKKAERTGKAPKHKTYKELEDEIKQKDTEIAVRTQ